jgi:hypothetical protein
MSTIVPDAFLDDFLHIFETSSCQTEFVVKLDTVAMWLNCHKRKLVCTLKRTYREGTDYIVTKNTDTNLEKKDPRNNNYKTYMITPTCFKRLVMRSIAPNGELLREYLIDIGNLLIGHEGRLGPAAGAAPEADGQNA